MCASCVWVKHSNIRLRLRPRRWVALYNVLVDSPHYQHHQVAPCDFSHNSVGPIFTSWLRARLHSAPISYETVCFFYQKDDWFKCDWSVFKGIWVEDDEGKLLTLPSVCSNPHSGHWAGFHYCIFPLELVCFVMFITPDPCSLRKFQRKQKKHLCYSLVWMSCGERRWFWSCVILRVHGNETQWPSISFSHVQSTLDFLSLIVSLISYFAPVFLSNLAVAHAICPAPRVSSGCLFFYLFFV